MKHPVQEPNTVPAGPIAGTIIGVVVAIGIGALVAHGILAWRTDVLAGDPSAPAEQMRGVPPEVNAMETLPFSVEAQGLASHQVAESHLSSYGWIDRDHRIVRVPIDVAFDLYLARGQGLALQGG
ncbi:MAG TPA: hypothetical protein VF469_03130, partial [Kofleriaceae bacterium]